MQCTNLQTASYLHIHDNMIDATWVSQYRSCAVLHISSFWCVNDQPNTQPLVFKDIDLGSESDRICEFEGEKEILLAYCPCLHLLSVLPYQSIHYY